MEDAKGLSDSSLSELMTQLNKKAYRLKGEVMIYELCQFIQSFLHENNEAPKGSFYDQMIEQKLKRDEAEMSMIKSKEMKLVRIFNPLILKLCLNLSL